MTKFKRIVSMFLAVVLVVGLVNLPAKAAENEVILSISTASGTVNDATTLVLNATGISGGHNFSEPSAADEGIFYNGQKVTKGWPILSYGGEFFWLALSDYGITNVQSGDKIKIVGNFVSHDGTYNFKEATFVFNGTKWTQEVTLSISTASNAQNTDTTLVLDATGISGGHNFSEPSAADEGIFYNGQKVTKGWPILSYSGEFFWLALSDYGIGNVKSGDKLKFVGNFDSHDGTYSFKEETFVFNGTVWEKYVAPTVTPVTLTMAADRGDIQIYNTPDGADIITTGVYTPVDAESGIFLNGTKLDDVTLSCYVAAADAGGKAHFHITQDGNGWNEATGNVLTIKGTFTKDDIILNIAEVSTKFNGSTWEVYVNLPEATTPTLYEADCTAPNGFYLTSDDTVSHDTEWNLVYSAKAGDENGVWFAGQQTNVYLKKILADRWYVCLGDRGFTADRGTVVTIKGTFASASEEVTFNETSYIYDGQRWITGDTLPTITEFTITGMGEYGQQSNFSRWLFRFTTSEEIAGVAFSTLLGEPQIQVGEATANAPIYPNETKGLALIVPFDAVSSTPADGTTITIPAGRIGNYELTKAFTMYYENGTWNEQIDPNDVDAEKVTFSFNVNRDDVLALSIDKIANPAAGTGEPFFAPVGKAKITYNGVKIKNPQMTQYGMYLAVDVMTDGRQKTAKYGDKITISGIWKYLGDNKFYDFGKVTYRYNGGGSWEVFVPGQDDYEMAKVKIYDIFELTNLSVVTMREGQQFNLADLKKKTNVGMRFQVDAVPDDVIFTLSKDVANNVWVNSGYEIKLVPSVNALRIVTMEPGTNGRYDEYIQANISNMDFSEPFEIEFAVADAYKNGTKKVIGRCIYVKINGEEVARWLDKDMDRPLGHYSAAWAGKETTIRSVKYEGYIPVDKNVGVKDFFDATGYAEKTVTPNECTYLGELKSKNSALKMNVDMTKTTGEFKIALGKKDKTTIWDVEESGYQFWFRPASNQIFIGYGMSEYATLVSHEFSENFVLEVGAKDVYHENGKYYGYMVYIKIDGKEVTSWVDENVKSRKLGTAIVAYGSADSDIVLSTLYSTYKLPVVYDLNGKDKDSTKFASAESLVVLNKPSKITITTKKDPTYTVNYNGTTHKKETLEEIEVPNAQIGVYTYEVKASKGDKVVVHLETKKLSTDKAEVYDIYDVMKVPSITVESGKEGLVGSTVDEHGRNRINTAVQLKVTIPESFNQIRWSMFSDLSNIWGYNGFIVKLLNNKVGIYYTVNESKLAESNCSLVQPNTTLYFESGVVKCYEEGNYKYDRYYVKVGKTLDSMELVTWFDSRERGGYGTTIAAYGMDVPNSFTISSVGSVKTMTDVSTQTNKEKLATYETFDTTNYAVYYPESVSTNASATIKLYTKDGAALKSLTVAGRNVIADVKQSEDGCYTYTIQKVTADVKFSYVIQ